MQKKIKVFEGTYENSIFSIDEFSFALVESEKGEMIKYQIEIHVTDYEPLDVRFFLEEIVPELEFVLDIPKELTYYIKKYEEDQNPNDESLFHDIRTKYVEFVKISEMDALNCAEKIMILGFSIVKEKIYIVIKAFSLNALSAFVEKLKNYCGENDIEFSVTENIRWLELKQYIVKKAEMTRGCQSQEFLEKTLIRKYFSKFMNIFKKIDRDGYFKKKFYKEVMFQEKTLSSGDIISVQINQVSKFFSPYWKYNINSNNKEILCLHDEMPSDGKVEEYVYTFKPSLMGYYLKNWFEDFTVEIIKKTDFSPYTVMQIMSGNRFNFFANEDQKNEREIDVIVNVEIQGISKLIAIECKKTLSDKEIQITNKKCREKIINSGNNLFDAFIHIGCFSNEVNFEKNFQGTQLKYKQGIIGGSDGILDVPFYTFDISSIEDYEKKLKYVIKDIFKNW